MAGHKQALALVLCAAVLAPQAVLAIKTGTAAATLDQDRSLDLKERPVMKVVRLLQDMQKELTAEMEDDKAVYEDLECWCKKNDQEKTAAIEMGSQKSKQLAASIEEYTGKIVELKATRASTLDELNKNIASLQQASELRMKENKEFHGSETDLMDAIAACQNAVIALSKHHPELAQLRSVAHTLLESRVARLVSGARGITPDSVEMLKSFLHEAQSASSFLAIPGYQSYRPQSGQIFGILKQMKEDFEKSLSSEQKAEMEAQKQYEELKAAKSAEIAGGKKAMTDIDAEIAEFGEKKAQAAKELEETDAQFALDTEYLKNLKAKCSQSEADYDARMASRQEEIAAVAETIQILNSDESFEAFDKLSPPSFLQLSASAKNEERKLRRRAVSVLQQAAAQSGSPKVALLASSAQLDAFTKVIEAIDKMSAELKAQQQEEVDFRDKCNKLLFENKKSTEAEYDKKDSLTAQQADLTKTIETLTANIAAAKEEAASVTAELKKAADTREADNADYQVTLSDQRTIQFILVKAIARMKEVYALIQQPGAPHIQTSGNATDPGNGPARFTEYGQNAGGARVVALLEKVLADSKKTMTDAIRDEQDAQAGYESLVKDGNANVKQLLKSIASMTANVAKNKEYLQAAKTDFDMTMKKLEGLSLEAGDTHSMCDFTLNNFDARQEARSAEIDALAEAKAILSGAAA